MTRALFTFLFLSACFSLRAQGGKAVFAELGGPGLASINYDMRFGYRQDGIGGRVGVGGFRIDNVTALFVPVGVNYLIGKITATISKWAAALRS